MRHAVRAALLPSGLMFESERPAHRFRRRLRRRLAKLKDLLAGDGRLVQERGSEHGDPMLIVTILREAGAVGVNTHIAQAADLLSQQGERVRIVSLDSWLPLIGPLLLAPCLAIRRTHFTPGIPLDRYLTSLSVELSIRRQLKLEKPTVIYAQDPRSAHAALRARGSLPIPVVMVVHYNESEAEELVNLHAIRRGGRADRAIRSFEAALIPRLDGLVLVSDFMRQHLYDVIPEAKAVSSAVIPNFLSDTRPSPADVVTRDCISVGYLVKRKNHGYLLHVLAAAKRQGHRYSLTLVGDGPEREPLQRLAAELGIADQVHFLGERFDIDELLRQHRVYVHSALMENCPFALLEGFRAGLPVVAAPFGGIPEVVGGDGSGRFWDLADPIGGARILSDLLENESELARAARRARARFESTYDADVVGHQLAQFLESARTPLSRFPG